MADYAHQPRTCARCATRLAFDNQDRFCAACRVKARDELVRPPDLPRTFWLHPHLRTPLTSWDFGQLIAAYRTHPHHGRVLSQATVAGWLGLTQATLSRLETGNRQGRLNELTEWAATLGIPPDLLWFKMPGDTRRVTASASSQPSDKAAVHADVIVDVHEDVAERIGYVLKHPASVDFLTSGHLRQAVHDLDEQYVHLPSTSLLAETGRYLGWTSFLSSHATHGRVRRELHTVEAEAAVLMGQLVWDASARRDHTGSHRYYDQAITAAKRSHDPTLEGLALLRKSMVALYGERNPRNGLTLAMQAAQTSTPTSSVLAGLATLHAAEAHALLKDQSACERALAEAETRFGQVAEDDEALHQYSPTVFGRMAGSCYLSLNQPKRAYTLLETTAAGFGEASKPQTIVLGNLALASIRQRNLDHAVNWLTTAIDAIEDTRSGGGLTVVFKAARELRPWRASPVVHDVYDRLLSLTTTM